MRAIVLVDHGSRAAEANSQLGQVTEQLKARLPDRFIVAAHMELAVPDLPTAIDACVSEGAREVVVAPWFLSPGRHGATDIPRLVEEARARHPGVELLVAEPLGVHPGLIDAVVDRISEGEDPNRRG